MPFSVENKETASAPCLSLWERCLSEAKTERVHTVSYTHLTLPTKLEV